MNIAQPGTHCTRALAYLAVSPILTLGQHHSQKELVVTKDTYQLLVLNPERESSGTLKGSRSNLCEEH